MHVSPSFVLMSVFFCLSFCYSTQYLGYAIWAHFSLGLSLDHTTKVSLQFLSSNTDTLYSLLDFHSHIFPKYLLIRSFSLLYFPISLSMSAFIDCTDTQILPYWLFFAGKTVSKQSKRIDTYGWLDCVDLLQPTHRMCLQVVGILKYTNQVNGRRSRGTTYWFSARLMKCPATTSQSVRLSPQNTNYKYGSVSQV